MSKPKLKQQAVGINNDAWFYENAKSIVVYIYIEDRGSVSCKIPRKLLADWLARTEEPK